MAAAFLQPVQSAAGKQSGAALLHEERKLRQRYRRLVRCPSSDRVGGQRTTFSHLHQRPPTPSSASALSLLGDRARGRMRVVFVFTQQSSFCPPQSQGFAGRAATQRAEWRQKQERRPLRRGGGVRAEAKTADLPEASDIAEASGSVDRTGLVDVVKIDREKFKSLRQRRQVFTHEDWRRHKSSGRYFRQIETILSSKVIQALAPPVTLMSEIAILICFWNYFLAEGGAPTDGVLLLLLPWIPSGLPVLHLSTLPYSLTAPALSLLLVFRTNSSYGRFDEARKMWGLMLNRSRDIARQALTYMAKGRYTYEYPKRAQFLRHLQAFPLAYKHHFVEEGTLEVDLRELTALSEDEIEGVLSATHRPNYVLMMMSECMGRCHMEPSARVAMETNFATFADDVGGSERLFKTPIPLSYTRLTSRFLLLYHLFLPLALWDSLGLLTLPVTVVHTFVFFCIDEVGSIIENPFPILALDAIGLAQRNNVLEMVLAEERCRQSLNSTMQESVRARKILEAMDVLG